MAKLKIKVAQDHLERLSKRPPIQALAELIWNALDGDAITVHIDLEENALGGLSSVHVVDDGTGIPHALALTAFENLGDSWKKKKPTSNGGRILHGKAGEGRFAAFALGDRVTWTSRWKDGKKVKEFRIVGDIVTLREFDVSDPVESAERTAGTRVDVTEIQKEPRSLVASDAAVRLATEFATYLHQYPKVNLYFNATHVDPRMVVERFTDYEITGHKRNDGRDIDATVTVVEWKIPQDRQLCLCDAGGFTLATQTVGIHAKGFEFTAYLKSDLIREYQEQNLLLEELGPPDLLRLVDAARGVLKDHFRRRAAEEAHDVVGQWKEEKVYPYVGQPKNLVEEVERQVFDVVALNINEFSPDFSSSDPKSKRLSLHMLKAALEQSPGDVKRLFQEVLELPQEKREELLELIEKTSLVAIINASKLIVDRLDFLAGLDHVLFDPISKKALKERRQLHRILVDHTWLFGEQFHLTVDDKGLTEVLHRHLDLLGDDRTVIAPVVTDDDSVGIVDLMLSRRLPDSHPENLEHLVIELKRPSVKIDAQVVSQLTKYALAVAKDDQFKQTTVRWNFIAVSNDISSDVELQYFNQKDRPNGLVINTDKPPFIRMHVHTWAQVLQAARARLEFVQKSLSYMADKDSGLERLRRTHSKYLPKHLREPFTRVDAKDVKPFENAVPLYDLRVAAGQFSPDKLIVEVPATTPFAIEDFTWVRPNAAKPTRGLFVAQIVGESMNRRVENGAWCLFRANPTSVPTGKPVIFLHRDIADADMGGQYTFKLIELDMVSSDEGETVVGVTLKPDSTDATFVPIILKGLVEGDVRVVAELVEVLTENAAKGTTPSPRTAK